MAGFLEANYKYVIEIAKTSDGWAACMQRTAHGKTELILTVKMETRHPVDGTI